MVCCSSFLRGEGPPHKKDSGWAWVVLVCVFITTWLSGGVGYSFGVFLPVFMQEFDETRDKAALVGSLQFATFLCLIVVSSQLCDRYGCRMICFIGHVISAAGFLLSSLPTTIVPLYFSHSLVTAFGSSCVQGGGYLIIGKYFKKRRSLAIGIVASSVGVGAICWGPLAQYLLGVMSWRNIFRLIAGLYIVLSVLTIVYDPNVEIDHEELERIGERPEQRNWIKKVFDLSIWRVPMYTIAVFSNMVACFGHHTAQIHVIKFALESGVSANKAASLFVFFGSTSVLARIAAGRLCDFKAIKPNYVNQTAEIISGLSTILLTHARTYTHLIVFSIFYGIADGGFRTTLNVLFLNSVGPGRMASAFGQGNMMISFFTASGPAIAGLMADHFDSYIPAFYMAGSVTILGSFVYLALLCVKTPVDEPAQEVAPQGNQNAVDLELEVKSPQEDHIFINEAVTSPQENHVCSNDNQGSEDQVVTSPQNDLVFTNEAATSPQENHVCSNDNLFGQDSEAKTVTSPQDDHVVCSESNLACEGQVEEDEEDTRL